MTLIPAPGAQPPEPTITTSPVASPEFDQSAGFGRWFALTESMGYPFDERAQTARDSVFADDLLDRWAYLGAASIGLGAVRRHSTAAGLAVVRDTWGCIVTGDGWHSVDTTLRALATRDRLTHLGFENYTRDARIIMHGPTRMPGPMPAYFLAPRIDESGPDPFEIYAAGVWWWNSDGQLQVAGKRMQTEPVTGIEGPR
jgi:hypothetical protein